MSRNPNPHPPVPAGIVAWVVVVVVLIASSGCTGAGDQSTLRARRAQAALTIGTEAVAALRPGVVAAMPEEHRETVDQAFAAARPTVDAAQDAISAYLASGAEGWKAALGCVGEAVQALLDAIRATGVTVGLSAMLDDFLLLLDLGAGFAGECEP
jgi:hypothetical protein